MKKRILRVVAAGTLVTSGFLIGAAFTPFTHADDNPTSCPTGTIMSIDLHKGTSCIPDPSVATVTPAPTVSPAPAPTDPTTGTTTPSTPAADPATTCQPASQN